MFFYDAEGTLGMRCADEVLSVFDVATGVVLLEQPSTQYHWILSRWSSAGRRLALSCEGALEMWDFDKTPARQARIESGRATHGLSAGTADGQRLAWTNGHGVRQQVRVHDASGRARTTLETELEDIQSASWSPDGAANRVRHQRWQTSS